MKNIIIFGGGFLGNYLGQFLKAKVITDRIHDIHDIEEALAKVNEKPEVIINCIGKTGRPNVDWCEKNREETFHANVIVPFLLAEYCRDNGIKFFHVSSGCIYQGDKDGSGWTEEDAPNFEGSYYSYTKALAEHMLSNYDFVTILRMRMPIGHAPNGRELIGKLLKYEKVLVEPNSVTVIDDFMHALEFLIRKNATGIFNVCNPEPITHKEILDIYEEVKQEKLNKIFINKDELVTDAPRSNCILNMDKIQNLRSNDEWGGLRPTKLAVRIAIENYVKNGG